MIFRVVSITMIALSTFATGMGCQATSLSPSTTPAIRLENVTWQLTEAQGRPAEPVPADERAAFIRFGEDQRVTGYGGVNQFGGSYELTGQALRFHPLAMTLRAGPEPLMRQEAAFSEALGKTASWRPAGEGIELLDSAGMVLARFKRAGG